MTKLDAYNKKHKLFGNKALTSTSLGAKIMDKFYCLQVSTFVQKPEVADISTTI